MPTNNPKISAYVPESVYNAVKKFQQERNLSMSQAATAIFSEYLGVDQVASGDTAVGGITLDRFEKLERQVAELQELKNQVSDLQQQVEQLKSTSNLPEAKPHLDGTSSQETAKETISGSPKTDQVSSQESTKQSTSELPDAKPHLDGTSSQETTEQSTGNVPGSKSNPTTLFSITEPTDIKLTKKQLARRLNISADYCRKIFKKSNPAQDTAERDPDGIAYEQVKSGRSYVYHPARDTPSEKLTKLQQWLDNQI